MFTTESGPDQVGGCCGMTEGAEMGLFVEEDVPAVRETVGDGLGVIRRLARIDVSTDDDARRLDLRKQLPHAVLAARDEDRSFEFGRAFRATAGCPCSSVAGRNPWST